VIIHHPNTKKLKFLGILDYGALSIYIKKSNNTFDRNLLYILHPYNH